MFPVPKGSLITSANCFILSSTLLCHSSIPPHSTLSLTLYFFLPLSLFSLSVLLSHFNHNSISLSLSLSLSLSPSELYSPLSSSCTHAHSIPHGGSLVLRTS